jgi:hypothetical protein
MSLYLKPSESVQKSGVHVERDYANKARRMIFGQQLELQRPAKDESVAQRLTRLTDMFSV